MSDPHHLLVVGGPETGRKIRVSSTSITVGRDAKNDVNLQDPLVSRHHCCFAFTDDGLTLTDLGSSNETLVNGKCVHEARLKVGDCITLGDTILRVVQANPPVKATPADGSAHRQTWRPMLGLIVIAVLAGIYAFLAYTPSGMPDTPDATVEDGSSPARVLEEEPLLVEPDTGDITDNTAPVIESVTEAPFSDFQSDAFADPETGSQADGESSSVRLLDQLRTVYSRETARINAEHAEEQEPWSDAYAASLMALQRSFQKAGDFQGAVAVDREIQRFRSRQTLIPSDIVDAPSSLSALQKKTGRSHMEIQMHRDRQLKMLQAQYQRHLLNLRAELTRAGELDKAELVNREIEQGGFTR